MDGTGKATPWEHPTTTSLEQFSDTKQFPYQKILTLLPPFIFWPKKKKKQEKTVHSSPENLGHHLNPHTRILEELTMEFKRRTACPEKNESK